MDDGNALSSSGSKVTIPMASMQTPATPQFVSKPCALCLENEPLLNSHIIPELMLKPVQDLLPTGTQGKKLPHVHQFDVHTLEPGRTLEKGHWLKHWGIKEYLLCGKCERILREGENYVRKTLYGTEPQMAHTPPWRIHRKYFAAGGWVGREERQVDYKLFRQFQVGIFWRCCVAKGKAFAHIQVDPALQEQMRVALRHGDLPERLVACRMRKMPGDPEAWLGTLGPAPGIENGVANLLMGGYRWQYDVEADPDSPLFLTRDGLLKIATLSSPPEGFVNPEGNQPHA